MHAVCLVHNIETLAHAGYAAYARGHAARVTAQMGARRGLFPNIPRTQSPDADRGSRLTTHADADADADARPKSAYSTASTPRFVAKAFINQL